MQSFSCRSVHLGVKAVLHTLCRALHQFKHVFVPRGVHVEACPLANQMTCHLLPKGGGYQALSGAGHVLEATSATEWRQILLLTSSKASQLTPLLALLLSRSARRVFLLAPTSTLQANMSCLRANSRHVLWERLRCVALPPACGFEDDVSRAGMANLQNDDDAIQAGTMDSDLQLLPSTPTYGEDNVPMGVADVNPHDVNMAAKKLVPVVLESVRDQKAMRERFQRCPAKHRSVDGAHQGEKWAVVAVGKVPVSLLAAAVCAAAKLGGRCVGLVAVRWLG